MRTLAATLALLACLAAACTGGEPPPPAPAATATPEATSTPTPTASATPDATSTPAPTATATPEATSTPAPPPTATPEARSGLEWIEPAPGAFVHRTFEDGEAIDWEHGIFVLDVETGLTEGYAVAGVTDDYGGYDLYRPAHRGGWIVSPSDSRKPKWRLLLDRETGQAWRWPIPTLRLAAASEHGLLFEDRGADRNPTGRFTLANRGMEEIAFRVARTGSCLRLREEPGEAGRVLACLPDGERLLFAERGAEAGEFASSPHPSLSTADRRTYFGADTAWAYVRTEDGAEGWVSHDWLDHD